jgi:hypothetical protein
MIAAHSDWSVIPGKRWLTIGRSRGDEWVVGVPQPVGDVSNILGRLADSAQDEGLVFGIDCPIGLPRAYARQLDGFADFPAFLKALTPDSAFFQVAPRLEDVSLARPFYPLGSVTGMGHKLALARALGMTETRQMSRMVDLQTATRPAAGQLFWTLGANQCGKAAIAAWRDLLLPAVDLLPITLWPFEGGLRDLAKPGKIVIAETYPAEALRQVGLKLNGSKRSQADRRALAPGLFEVMTHLRIKPAAELNISIGFGFGAEPSGEDAFDSLVGALGIINVLNGNRPDAPPLPVDIWEGWVLGQTDLPLEAPAAPIG